MQIQINLDEDFKDIYSTINKKCLEIEGIEENQLDILKNIERIENGETLKTDENANASNNRMYSMIHSEAEKPIKKINGFNELYKSMKTKYGKELANNAIKSLLEGDLYLHDSCYIQIPYCWASSVQSIAEGKFINEQLKSFAPKKRRSFIDMTKEFVIQLSHEIAGAVAISDIFVYYAYYAMIELDEYRKLSGLSNNISYTNLMTTKFKHEIEDDFQSFVHTINMKMREGTQSPFTNVSIFDMPNLKLLFSELIYPNGKTPDFELIMEIQKIFCNWFAVGDPSSGLPYRFPVCTLNIRINDSKEVLDKETFDYFCGINLNNSPFNIYISNGHKIASCCRLLSSIENQIDSLGNGGISVGSLRVCTINLARIGHNVKTYNLDLENELYSQLATCQNILLSHKELIKDKINKGLLYMFSNKVMNLSRLFCTIGINGAYECVQELGYDPLSREGMKIYEHVLSIIHNFSISISNNTDKFNCEEVPAESLAGKFARKDKVMLNMKYQQYSNQLVPLYCNVDIVDRVKYEGMLSHYLNGGCITHINMIEKITQKSQMMSFIEYIIKQGVEHFAINYNFCICKNKHITTNKPGQKCRICNEAVSEFTRIIGYFVPVSQFCSDRKIEYLTRTFY
jgi:ribonucleoside-triphosphate reductase